MPTACGPPRSRSLPSGFPSCERVDPGVRYKQTELHTAGVCSYRIGAYNHPDPEATGYRIRTGFIRRHTPARPVQPWSGRTQLTVLSHARGHPPRDTGVVITAAGLPWAVADCPLHGTAPAPSPGCSFEMDG